MRANHTQRSQYAERLIALKSTAGKKKLRVTLVIDTGDRDLVAREASAAGLNGESARNVIVLAVKTKFGGSVAPIPIDF